MIYEESAANRPYRQIMHELADPDSAEQFQDVHSLDLTPMQVTCYMRKELKHNRSDVCHAHSKTCWAKSTLNSPSSASPFNKCKGLGELWMKQKPPIPETAVYSKGKISEFSPPKKKHLSRIYIYIYSMEYIFIFIF